MAAHTPADAGFVLEYAEADVATVARTLLQRFGQTRVWALVGDLGAGKTTLVRALAQALGAQVPATSPTFTLAHTYETPQGSIHHLDLYRLTSAEEAYDMGLTEYLDTGYLCLIEWPEVANDFLPANTLWLQLEHATPHSRKLHVSVSE